MVDQDVSVTAVEVIDGDIELNDDGHETSVEDLDEDESSDDISLKLDSVIRQSQKSRHLWEKFNALPP